MSWLLVVDCEKMPLSDLLNSPWIGFAGLLVGIVCVILAVFFYIRGKRERLPRFDTRTNNIVSDLRARFDALQMLYANQQIDNLSVTRVILWNAGRQAIRASDIAPTDPVAIRVSKPYQILDARVLGETAATNRFRVFVSNDRTEVTCQFDYVDHGQGAVLQVIHTAKVDNDVRLDGTVIEAGRFNRRHIDVEAFRGRKGRAIFGVISLFNAMFIIYVVVQMFRTVTEPSLLSAGLGLILVALFSWGAYRFLVQRFVPKGLESFCESF